MGEARLAGPGLVAVSTSSLGVKRVEITFDVDDGGVAGLVAPGTGCVVRWNAVRDLGAGSFTVRVRVVPRDLGSGRATPSAATPITLD